MASLTNDARDLLALSGAVHRRITADPSAFWVKSNLDIENQLFPALRQIESIGFARGSDDPDRLALLTLAQLQALFPEFAAPGIAKSALLTAVFESTASQDINQRLRKYPEAASPNLLTVGLAAGRDADWFLQFCDLLADWLTRRAEMADAVVSVAANGGTPGGWHIIRAERCRQCAAAPVIVSEHATDGLPPFHIGCHCKAVADGKYGMPAGVIAALRKPPRKTATKAKTTQPRKQAPPSPTAGKTRKPARKSRKKSPSLLAALTKGVVQGLAAGGAKKPAKKAEKKNWHYY